MPSARLIRAFFMADFNARGILEQTDFQTREKVNEALSLLKQENDCAPKQLLLFEDFKLYNERLVKKSPKTEKGLSLKQEAAARLLALGLPLTQIYILLHDGADFENKNSLWARASKFCNDKVRLRAEEIRKEADKKALMPLTEAFERLTQIAKNGAKDEVRRAALVDILKLHGAYSDKQDVSQNIKVEIIDHAND